MSMLFDFKMLLLILEILLMGILLLSTATLLYSIIVKKEICSNSFELFFCTLGLIFINIGIPLFFKLFPFFCDLWVFGKRTALTLQDISITFSVYDNVIWIIVLLCIGACGIAKRKYEPSLALLSVGMVLIGHIKIGLLGAILAGVQFLIWNIIVSNNKS